MEWPVSRATLFGARRFMIVRHLAVLLFEGVESETANVWGVRGVVTVKLLMEVSPFSSSTIGDRVL
jgi:hypothetical protein